MYSHVLNSYVFTFIIDQNAQLYYLSTLHH